MKRTLQCAVIVVLAWATGACQPAKRPGPVAVAADSAVIECLGSDNHFIVARAEARILATGARAIPGLSKAAKEPVGAKNSSARLQRNAIRLLWRIAEADPDARCEVIDRLADALVTVASPGVASAALERLKGLDRHEVLLALAREASGADATRRGRARAAMIVMDTKGSVDVIIGLLTGAESASWYGEDAKPSREPLLALALRKLTFKSFGYRAKDPPEVRKAALAEWASWWAEHRKSFGRMFRIKDIKTMLGGLKR